VAWHNQFDTNRFFVDWNESNSMDDMQRRWPDVSKVNLSARASKLRDAGYDLKNLRDKSSTEDFIATVNAAETLDEAATILNTTKEHVKVRAAQLRRLGVFVKTFPRKRRA
jgi:hypothetical protein